MKNDLPEQIGQHAYIPGKRASAMQAITKQQQIQAQSGFPVIKTPVPDEVELEDDDAYYPQIRQPSSARRYQTTIPQPQVLIQGNRRFVIHQGPPLRRKPAIKQTITNTDHHTRTASSRLHWLFFVGVCMLTMLVGWMLLTLLANWWQVTQDDWRYGRPRTFQVDQVVGHGDRPDHPSHFIALNLNHQVEVIEFPGGNASLAKVYLGPTLIGQGQDLAVVTLTFVDVNGDGKLDMIVSVLNSHYVFINDHGQFRPAHPDEHLTL